MGVHLLAMIRGWASGLSFRDWVPGSRPRPPSNTLGYCSVSELEIAATSKLSASRESDEIEVDAGFGSQ